MIARLDYEWGKTNVRHAVIEDDRKTVSIDNSEDLRPSLLCMQWKVSTGKATSELERLGVYRLKRQGKYRVQSSTMYEP